MYMGAAIEKMRYMVNAIGSYLMSLASRSKKGHADEPSTSTRDSILGLRNPTPHVRPTQVSWPLDVREFTEGILCFDLRASFSSAPPHIVLCLWCSSPVILKAVQCSEPAEQYRRTALIPLLQTYVSECSNCGWWAIREFREERELDAGSDYVVMLSPDPLKTHRKDLPCWELVLKDEVYWKKSGLIPRDLASRLFRDQGGDVWQLKHRRI